MPITKSAKISIRHSARRQKINAKIRRAAKKAISAFRKSPNAKTLKEAYSQISKAAKKGVFHENKASRLKSRLAKHLNKTQPKKKAKTGSKKTTSKKTAPSKKTQSKKK